LPFVAVTSRRKLPDRNGRVIQLYGYDLFAANTTPGTEGTVGTGINPTTSVRNVAVNQYFDFASFSDILVETAIDPIVENTAAEMGYRAALTANVLARTEFEAEATADSTIVISCTDNEFLSASLTRQAVMSLRGADVRPQTDGLFAGIIHPFAAFDLLNDNTAGGVIDILNGVVCEKSWNDNRPNSVNISETRKHRAKLLEFERTCRDYVGETLNGQEIVRAMSRGMESSRNAMAA
jgi:N4-gp56 family major capsid protein